MAELTFASKVFATRVEGADALLAEPPEHWSYSSLREVELCPRKYELSRAGYPNLWTGRGFPRSVAIAAIKGSVVHVSVEEIVNALARVGCASVSSEQTVNVLRELGGLTAVANGVLSDQLATLSANPRVSAQHLRHIDRTLHNWLPEAREEIQTYLSRVKLVGGINRVAPPPVDTPPRRASGPIQNGDHPERTLTAPGLKISGRVDLLTVTPEGAILTDFKTGRPDSSHSDQLHLYALLWTRDTVANPNGLPVIGLTVSYPTRDVDVGVPTPEEMLLLEKKVSEMVVTANATLSDPNPVARPGGHCSLCDVRVLCDAYWAGSSATRDVPQEAWHDVEGKVIANSGVKSWELCETQGGAIVTLRTPQPTYELPLNRYVRILGARRVADPEEQVTLVSSLNSASEVFVLSV